MVLADISVSTGSPATWGDQASKIITAAPPLVLALLVVAVVWRLRHLLPAIASRLTDLEAFGVKFSLAGGQALTAAVDMARKNPRWEGEAPVADQKRALERARRERARLDSAEILWVDDCPSNNRNEARMLASFGCLITFACTTEEALRALDYGERERQPFDLIVSDIGRELPDPDPSAGVEMLPRLRAARHAQPVIFYVGRLRKDAGAPPDAFGITARPDELLNLILDALARTR